MRLLKPWTSQPQWAARANAKWVARGLSFLSSGDHALDSVTGLLTPVTTVNGTRSLIATSGGLGTTHTGANSRNIANRDLFGNGNFTVFMYGNVSSSSAQKAALSQYSSGGTQKIVFGANFDDQFSSAPGRLSLTLLQPSVNRSHAYVASGVDGSLSVYCFRKSGTTISAFKNGQPLTVTTLGGFTGSPAASDDVAKIQGDNSNSAFAFTDTLLGTAAFRGLALSDAEIAAISANPWQLFSPRSIWLPAQTAAGGGTATITQADGVATTSTLAGTSTAESAITSVAGAATASTLTGSSVAAATITQADGVATTSTLVGEGLAAGTAAFVAASGAATTSALAGTSTAESAITQATGSATASTLVGSDAAQVVSYSGGFWWPHQRKRTRREIDEERRKLGILPPEVLEAVAAVKPERRRIKLVELVGKPKAARITNVDLSEAIAISKKRKRQREDELLLLM